MNKVGPHAGQQGALFCLGATEGTPILYIHGGTLPCAMMIGYAFDRHGSGADALDGAGFTPWGLDFPGYGRGDIPAAFASDPAVHPPLCPAIDMAEIVIAALEQLHQRYGRAALVIAHSWGTMAALRAAGTRPDMVARLALIGPIAARAMTVPNTPLPAWIDLTLEAQHTRFSAEVLTGYEPVLAEPDLRTWGAAWYAMSARHGDGVQVPSGFEQDLRNAFSGKPDYDASRVSAPTLLLRGAWDTICTDKDMATLWHGLANCHARQMLTIDRATHVPILEQQRFAVWAAIAAFFHTNSASQS